MIVGREAEKIPAELFTERFRLDEQTITKLVSDRLVERDVGVLWWRYVGFIKTSTDLIVIVPKVVNRDWEDWLLIRRVLSRYFATSSLRKPIITSLEDLDWRDERVFNELDSATTLLRFFVEHGPYRVSKRRRSTGGAIDWGQTLRSAPVQSDSGPVYVDLVMVRRHHEANEITSLILGFLKYLLDKYPVLPSPTTLPDVTQKYGAVEYEQILENREYFTTVVRSERAITFQTDQIVLLETLLSLLSIDEGTTGRDLYSLFGVNKFEKVWEDVCRDSIGGDDESLRNQLAKPVWVWSNYLPTVADRQNPDVLSSVEGKILIVDAKYYFPVPPQTTPWGDIAKQLVYAQSIPANGAEIVNVFVFPGLCDSFEVAGYLDVRNDVHVVGKIDLWRLDFTSSLIRYAYKSGKYSSFISALATRSNFDDRPEGFA